MAKKPINEVLIERVVNRRALAEVPANVIWEPIAGETDADFQTRREAWFKLLFAKPKKELEADLPASAGVLAHDGADPATYYGDLKDAIEKSHKNGAGPFLAGYRRVRELIARIVDHEIVDCNLHLVAEVHKAYLAGYQNGHDDHMAGKYDPGAGWTDYEDEVEEYDPDASLHHTY